MLTPNARITIKPDDIHMEVLSSTHTLEVRDYRSERIRSNPEQVWRDGNNYMCVRYFVKARQDAPSTPRDTVDLRRFAEDLSSVSGVTASVVPSEERDGLHTLKVNEMDFYFRADGHGYDGWGKCLGLFTRKPKPNNQGGL